jgi:hypothetical protein
MIDSDIPNKFSSFVASFMVVEFAHVRVGIAFIAGMCAPVLQTARDFLRRCHCSRAAEVRLRKCIFQLSRRPTGQAPLNPVSSAPARAPAASAPRVAPRTRLASQAVSRVLIRRHRCFSLCVSVAVDCPPAPMSLVAECRKSPAAAAAAISSNQARLSVLRIDAVYLSRRKEYRRPIASGYCCTRDERKEAALYDDKRESSLLLEMAVAAI